MPTTAITSLLSSQDLARISGLSTPEDRRKFLTDHKSFVSADVVAELNAATMKEFRVNTATALVLADTAIQIANILCRLELLAQSKRIKAHVLSERGEYQPPSPSTTKPRNSSSKPKIKKASAAPSPLPFIPAS